MDERFRRVFRDLYDAAGDTRDPDRLWERRYLYRRYDVPDQNVTLLVRDAVERAIGKLEFQDRLRWDARYFLLINFSQMIAEPLALDPERRTDLNELASDIQADAELVLRRASGETFGGRGDNPEISGGDVLQSVASNYRELRVNRFKVWN